MVLCICLYPPKGEKFIIPTCRSKRLVTVQVEYMKRFGEHFNFVQKTTRSKCTTNRPRFRYSFSYPAPHMVVRRFLTGADMGCIGYLIVRRFLTGADRFSFEYTVLNRSSLFIFIHSF